MEEKQVSLYLVIFLKLLGKLKNRFPGGPVRQPFLTYRPARLHRLGESFPWKRFLGSGDSDTRFFASGFFHQSVSPQPQSIPLGPFRIFSKIRGNIRSSRLTTGFVDTGGKWKKSSIRKNFNNFVGTPLDNRVNIYIHFCLQVHFKVSAAWY